MTVGGGKDFVELRRLGIQIAPQGAPAVATNGYDRENWNRVDYHERRKAGWPAVRRAMLGAAER